MVIMCARGKPAGWSNQMMFKVMAAAQRIERINRADCRALVERRYTL